MMEIYRIIDELELMLKESKKVPLSNGKAMIEIHRFLDRLDRLRAILPEELDNARQILTEKDRIVKQACAEADEYMAKSKNTVARMVDDNEITRNAMDVADQIVAKAEEVAMEIRRDANEYADGVLTHMEIILRKGLEVVGQGKDEIREALKSGDI